MHPSSKNWLYSEKSSGCSRIQKSPHQSYFTIAAQLIGFSVTPRVLPILHRYNKVGYQTANNIQKTHGYQFHSSIWTT